MSQNPLSLVYVYEFFWRLWNFSILRMEGERSNDGSGTSRIYNKFMIAIAESTRDESRSTLSFRSFTVVSTQRLHIAVSWHPGLRSLRDRLTREDVSRNNSISRYHSLQILTENYVAHIRRELFANYRSSGVDKESTTKLQKIILTRFFLFSFNICIRGYKSAFPKTRFIQSQNNTGKQRGYLKILWF